jgi:hypothetical protein
MIITQQICLAKGNFMKRDDYEKEIHILQELHKESSHIAQQLWHQCYHW